MKKIIKNLLNLVLAIVILITGIFIGQSRENKDIVTKLSEQSKTEKIAVVNLDSGINKNKKVINYSTNFMNDSDLYEFTGLQEARSGIENDTYSSYIVIPENFSKNVDSINGKPIKIELEYKINNNLDKDTKEKTIYNIKDIESDLNHDISYMYISSILTEFHGAQENADLLIANTLNNQKTINGVNFNKSIDFLDIKEPTNNSKLIDGLIVNGEYNEDINKLNISLNNIENEVKQLITPYSSSVLDLKNKLTNYNINRETMDILHSDENGKALAYTNMDLNSALTSAYQKFSTNFVTDLTAVNTQHEAELLDLNNLLNTYKGEVAAAKNAVANEYNEFKAAITNYNGCMIAAKSDSTAKAACLAIYDTAKTEMEASINAINTQTTVPPAPGPISNSVNNQLIAISTKYGILDQVFIDEMNTAANDLAVTNYANKIKTNYENKLLQRDNKQYVDKEINAIITSYNDSLKLNSSTLNEYKLNFNNLDKKITSTKESINNKSKELYNYNIDINKQANDYYLTLKEDVKNYETKAQLDIKNNLKAAEDSIKNNSINNQELLADFTTKLKNTRNGTVGNTDTYDQIAQPLKAKDKTTDTESTTIATIDNTNRINLMLVIIIIMLVTKMILDYKKQKQEE
ncbi:MAG: hypothetical protein RR516_03440 [Erysipelotrichaceae bacterium]